MPQTAAHLHADTSCLHQAHTACFLDVHGNCYFMRCYTTLHGMEGEQHTIHSWTSKRWCGSPFPVVTLLLAQWQVVVWLTRIQVNGLNQSFLTQHMAA